MQEQLTSPLYSAFAVRTSVINTQGNVEAHLIVLCGGEMPRHAAVRRQEYRFNELRDVQ